MTTALITGAGCFSGRALALRLRRHEGLRIIGAGRRVAPLFADALDRYRRVDVGDAADVARLIGEESPDWIFHLAGLRQGAMTELHRTNVLGAFHLLDAVRTSVPQARVLLVGSAAEYGPVAEARQPVTEDEPCSPITPYGIGKRAATVAGLDYVERFGLHVVVARTFNLVGAGVPEGLVVGDFIARIRNVGSDGVIRMGRLETQRDFVDVEDVVDAYVRMIEGDFQGEVFNLCSGRAVSIRTVVDILTTFSSRPVRVQSDEALQRDRDVSKLVGSWKKAERAFGFRPVTPLETSLRSAWEGAMRKSA